MRRWALAIILLLSLLPDPGEAAESLDIIGLRPLSPYGIFATFSAESLKQNKVGLAFTYERSVDPNFNRTVFQLAYGIHDRLEVNFTIPYVFGGEDRGSGFEDFNLGVKYRFIEEGRYVPALALLLSVAAPSGDDPFSTNGGVGGGLLLTKKVGPFKGHFNFLYSNPQKSGLNEQYLLNTGLELAITRDSKVLAELVGRKNFFESKLDLLEWRLGYRIATTDYLYTTIGAGFNIKNRTPDYRLFFSLSVILPREKKQIQKIYEE